MKKLCFVFIFCLFGAASVVRAQAESAGAGCPADKVCISREAALKAVENAETVKAQAVQIEALKKAIDDEKDVANALKIQFAEKSGENTALKQNAVADRAIIELLLKSVKKKCMPLSVCF